MCRYHSRHDDWRQTKKKEGVHVRHSLLTGVKRLQVTHDCFGIGAYQVRTGASGRGEACRFARLRSSAPESSPRYYAYSAIKDPNKGHDCGSGHPAPTIQIDTND